MKVLLVGVGGVGEAIAVVAKDRPWLTKMVLADYNIARAEEVQAKLGDPAKFSVERIDASDRAQIVQLARKHEADLIMNAVDPVFNEAIFDAAFEAGATYMDMAMTLSHRHPEDPYHRSGVKLGDYQFERSAAWEEKGQLALVGMGVEPGMADVFAKYAAKHLFDEIDEIGVRDGANLVVEGYDFAPNFSIWTTIEECLNPPVVWEKERGWFTTETFSEPEVFDFPEGIGPVECVNVEHEEVLLIPPLDRLQARDVQVRLGRRVHQRVEGDRAVEPRQDREGEGEGRRGLAARRHRGVSSRPRAPGRSDARQDLRGHVGPWDEGRQAA